MKERKNRDDVQQVGSKEKEKPLSIVLMEAFGGYAPGGMKVGNVEVIPSAVLDRHADAPAIVARLNALPAEKLAEWGIVRFEIAQR